jgi:HK97 family phage prohead protease
MERKDNIRFDIKSLSENGEFEGLASVFGNIDQGKDIVHPGAFSQTINRRKGRVPLLRGHAVPVGVAYVEETPDGLKTRGVLNLEKQDARDAYSDLKFYRDHDMPMGMSFGFDIIQGKQRDDKGIRHLRELKLHEVTLTEFPMNELAGVDPESIKSVDLGSLSEMIEDYKAGRRISTETMNQLRTLMEHNQQIADKLRTLMETEESPSAEPAEVVSEEPVEAAKSADPDEPVHPSSKSGLSLLPLTFDFKSITEVQ